MRVVRKGGIGLIEAGVYLGSDKKELECNWNLFEMEALVDEAVCEPTGMDQSLTLVFGLIPAEHEAQGADV